MKYLQPRERIIRALELKPLKGRVPHYEMAFFLTMEALGKVHPSYRDYSNWFQMTDKERDLHRNDVADLFINIAEKYDHSAIFIRPNPSTLEESIRLLDLIREKSNTKFFLMMHGDATFGITQGPHFYDFIYKMKDEPQKLKNEAEKMLNEALERAYTLHKHGGLDGFSLNTDYCFNNGPFISPSHFSEFIMPYLVKLIGEYRNMGFYVIKHTDGNIMPILDLLIESNPHALHSLDPQAGVDIKKVRELVGHKVCLIGNINCSLLQLGPEEKIIESVRYSLENGMSGGGYIFSTSNCIYTGMPLEAYKKMLEIWRTEGIYD